GRSTPQVLSAGHSNGVTKSTSTLEEAPRAGPCGLVPREDPAAAGYIGGRIFRLDTSARPSKSSRIGVRVEYENPEAGGRCVGRLGVGSRRQSPVCAACGGATSRSAVHGRSGGAPHPVSFEPGGNR